MLSEIDQCVCTSTVSLMITRSTVLRAQRCGAANSRINDPYELQFELDISGGQTELDALYGILVPKNARPPVLQAQHPFRCRRRDQGLAQMVGCLLLLRNPPKSSDVGYYAASHSGFCLGFEFPSNGAEDTITQATSIESPTVNLDRSFRSANFMGDALDAEDSLRTCWQ